MTDQATFLRHFLAAQSDLRAYIRSMVREGAAAEDVLQETSLTLWQDFGAYDPARSFGAWARGVATFKILQRRRADDRFPLAFAPETIQAVQEAYAHGTPHESHRVTALDDCVAGLPAKSARLLTLRYADECSISDIAALLLSTPDGIYQALSRLRSSLAECVTRRLSTPTLRVVSKD